MGIILQSAFTRIFSGNANSFGENPADRSKKFSRLYETLANLLKLWYTYSILNRIGVLRVSRENKKDAVAALHRAQIMKAAEKLFSEKGYEQTTIEDISKASEYSRRTIYSYYESKDDILHHIIERGLMELKKDMEAAIHLHEDFVTVYQAICRAMCKYQNEYGHSADHVNRADAAHFDSENLSETVQHILFLGTEINTMLAAWIEYGKEAGIVRQDIIPTLTVYILWSNITSFLTLVQTKGSLIAKQFSISESELLDYGFRQILNSILQVHI